MNRFTSHHHFPVGSQLERAKGLGLVRHVGIYLGDDQVFHNSPGRGEHISSLSDFAQNQPVRMTAGPSPAALQTVFRARQQATQPRPYSLLSWNCEHTARAVAGAPPESPQLQMWVALGLLYWGLRSLARA